MQFTKIMLAHFLLAKKLQTHYIYVLHHNLAATNM